MHLSDFVCELRGLHPDLRASHIIKVSDGEYIGTPSVSFLQYLPPKHFKPHSFFVHYSP